MSSISKKVSKTLHSRHRLGQFPLLRHQHRLELPRRHCRSQHPEIYTQGTPQVPTLKARFPPTSTLPECPIQYGARVQRVNIDTSAPLTPEVIKRVQDIVSTLLYYGRAIDSTLLSALSSIAARQSNGTQAVAKACDQLLNYVATHPNASICYKACDMILAVHTNVLYLSEPGGKSHASAHLYLTNHNDKTFNNGAILTLSSIIKHVMSSALESKLAALYYGC
jgi:hypothetical protein